MTMKVTKKALNVVPHDFKPACALLAHLQCRQIRAPRPEDCMKIEAAHCIHWLDKQLLVQAGR